MARLAVTTEKARRLIAGGSEREVVVVRFSLADRLEGPSEINEDPNLDELTIRRRVDTISEFSQQL
jgi:hypothetical protein